VGIRKALNPVSRMLAARAGDHRLATPTMQAAQDGHRDGSRDVFVYQKVTPRAPTKPNNAEAGWAHYIMKIALLQLHVLGEAVHVADIPVMIIVVEGRQVARGSDVATRGGGGATQRHSLSTCQPHAAPVLLEENAATVTKLLFVRLITKGRKMIVCLFVG
jgi:hypothetical protein